MHNQRINEVLQLLKPNWLKNKELSLLELLTLFRKEAVFEGALNELSDQFIIDHLKVAQTRKNETVHLIDEMLELLEPYWLKNKALSLLELLTLLSKECGFKESLDKLSDEIIIYHLKMDQIEKGEVIPGIKKDFENDFQTALLKARGII